MKKILFFTLLALFMPMLSNAYTAENDGIYYNFSGDKAEVTRGSSDYSGDVVIPSFVTYNGITYCVTSIGEYAFYSCSSLTSITIPNSVTSIGDDAFFRCCGLTSITIPNSVTTIGKGAFEDCSGLTSITIPNNVTSIGNNAFLKCSNITSLSLDCENIGEWFSSCKKSLMTVILGDNVKTIGYSAFSSCSSLTSINIPNSVTTIGESAFSSCTGLTSINIPNSVTSIGRYAFYGCSSLTSINIPNSVTSIGKCAFSDCSNLTTIKVETGNAVYDSRNNCNALIETVSNTLIVGCKNSFIPNSVTSIDDYAFYRCSSLTSITIPNSVTSIGRYAFRYCRGLTSITIGSGVTTIGKSAFEDCSGLTSITIGSGVTTIGESAFDGCSNLESITIPESVIYMEHDTFLDTPWFNNQPDGMVYAGKVAYEYKGTMPEGAHIDIKEGTLGIAGYAFNKKGRLFSVTIPNSVIAIGHNAFSGLRNLTSVNIGSGVKDIGEEAFHGCISLREIISYIQEPFAIDTMVFHGIADDATLYVPFGTKTLYEAAVGWNEIKDIVEMEQTEDTDISQLDNAIYIEPFSARIGDNTQMEICLKNAEAATAYVFDLVLPEGITVAKDTKGKYIDVLSDRHDDHTRTFNYKGDNTYSLSTLSGNSEELSGNDGTIRLVTLYVDESVTEGVYPIQISKASYSRPDGSLVSLPNTRTSVTVEDYLIGDVNGNGGVDIGDAVSIVNYLVGKESSIFVEKAADTNHNGQIDIGDAVTIVNFLVGKTDSLSPNSVKAWSENEPQ